MEDVLRSVEMVQVERTIGQYTKYQTKIRLLRERMCALFFFCIWVEGKMDGQRNRYELIYWGRSRPWYTHKKPT